MAATDPVRKMTVEKDNAAASYRYGDQSYYSVRKGAATGLPKIRKDF